MGQLYLAGDTGHDTELGSVTRHEPTQLPPRPACLLKTCVEPVIQLTVQTARAVNNVNCLRPSARVGDDASDGKLARVTAASQIAHLTHSGRLVILA